MFGKNKNGINRLDRVYYINYSKGRESQIKDVLNNLDADFRKVKKINAIITDNIRETYIKSHLEALKDALKNKHDNFLILEDSFIATNDFLFNNYINKLFEYQTDWDVISLCDSVESDKLIENIDNNNSRLGYIVNGNCVNELISHLESELESDNENNNTYKDIKVKWYSFNKKLGQFSGRNLYRNTLDFILMITTYNRKEVLNNMINSWIETKSDKINWKLIIADDGSTDGTIDYIKNLKVDNVDIILIENKRRGVHHQTNQLIKKALEFNFDFGFKCDDDLIFLKKDWDIEYYKTAVTNHYYHLIFNDIDYKSTIDENIQGALWTFNKNVLEDVGYYDLNNFNLCGYGHVDYSIRCCRAGYNNIDTPFDLKDSEEYIKLSDYESNKCLLDWNSLELIDYKKSKLSDDRIYIPYNELNIDINKNIITGDIYKSDNRVQSGISIIVSAYESGDYIEECLDSISNQTYFDIYNNYEILVGIDGCQKTLDKVKKIANKYNNIKVYMMSDNKGTYVTCNTLLDLAKYDKILRFDSDDVMKSDMIEKLMMISTDWDCMIYKFDDFGIRNWNNIGFSYGSRLFKRDFFDKFGGWENWPCSADYELAERSQKNCIIKELDDSVFLRRSHKNSLTRAENTKDGSKIRIECDEKVRSGKYDRLIYVERVTNDFKKINVPLVFDWVGIEVCENNTEEISYEKGVSVVISAYEAQEFIEECLDSIQNQTYFKDFDNYEILVGVDGCKKTLKKLKEIQYKYKNLRLFWIEENSGPYLVFNTLILNSKYDVISRFDADDIMYDIFIKECLLLLKDDNIIRVGGDEFEHPNQNKIIRTKGFDGVIVFNKFKFINVNGYFNFRCGGDSDILWRFVSIGLRITNASSLMLRRVHKNSLTNNTKTNFNSEYRQDVINEINIRKEKKIIVNEKYAIAERYNEIKKTISVNMATYPERKESFIKVIKHLLTIDMIDIIRIYLNEYKEIPDEFPKNKKILYHLGEKNLKDSGKFYWANSVNEYYFTIDDDLIYPKSYFKEHIKLLKQYESKIFITLHGKVMKKNPTHMNDYEYFFHCLKTVEDSVWVNNGGTGVMLFDSGQIKIPMKLFKYHGMTDLYIAVFAQKNQIPILCRKHFKDELELIKNENTLFDQRDSMKSNHLEILYQIDNWLLYKNN